MSAINLPELPLPDTYVWGTDEPTVYSAEALVAYAEQAVREALDHAFNELNSLFLETIKARIPGEDLDHNDEQFNIGMCAQALGISRCQQVLCGLAPHPEKDHGEST